MGENSYYIERRQSNISRLAAFAPHSYLHMLTYRILVFLAIITGIVLTYSVVTGALTVVARLLLLITWVLLTPQFYEVVRGLVLIQTKGFVFGNMNPYFVKVAKTGSAAIYKAWAGVPYAVMVVWAAAIVIAAATWFL